MKPIPATAKRRGLLYYFIPWAVGFQLFSRKQEVPFVCTLDVERKKQRDKDVKHQRLIDSVCV